VTAATTENPTKAGEPLLLAGRPIAAERRAAVERDVAAYRRMFHRPPVLAVVFVGRNAPSAVYLHQIIKGCTTVGIDGRIVEISGRVTSSALGREIERLNRDPSVDGVIVQMPLPRHISLRAVIDTLDPSKDIDGLHPMNAGLLALGYDGFVPATARSAVELLKAYEIPIDGKRAVVVGRSNVVGKPVARLLQAEHATISVAHTHTQDLPALTREAEILVVATGVPGLIKGSMIQPGAVVVDIGINVVGGEIVGDVDYASACKVVSAITPVPGGVGPLTNAILLGQLMHAARGTGPAKEVRSALERMAGLL
jgi:methylenetetrahydrofolate dehydrogenase (NADP+)/methenyltetrahydrofolate cyclohydrolase